jgi:hypothetical protein
MNLRRRLIGMALTFALLLSVAAAPASAASPRQFGGSWICSWFQMWQNNSTFARPFVQSQNFSWFNDFLNSFCNQNPV